MKNYYLILLSVIISLSFFSGCIENKQTSLTTLTPESTPLQKQYIDMDIEQFSKALIPPTASTELQKEEFYNSLNRFNGKYVKWRLQIVDVNNDGVLLHVLQYGDDVRIIVVMAEDQKSELIKLNKGEYITIEGIPDYKKAIISFYSTLLEIKLYDGRIISKG